MQDIRILKTHPTYEDRSSDIQIGVLCVQYAKVRSTMWKKRHIQKDITVILDYSPSQLGKRVLIELYNNEVQMRARKLRGNGYGSRFWQTKGRRQDLWMAQGGLGDDPRAVFTGPTTWRGELSVLRCHISGLGSLLSIPSQVCGGKSQRNKNADTRITPWCGRSCSYASFSDQ